MYANVTLKLQYFGERNLFLRYSSSIWDEKDKDNFLGILELRGSFHLLIKESLDEVRNHQKQVKRM